MCQTVIFSLLIIFLSRTIAIDYFVILTSNGPVVRGAEITFTAKLYTRNGNEADSSTTGSTYRYQWEDNGIPYHQRDVKITTAEDKWTITYPADVYPPGPYNMQVEVSKCNFIFCYSFTSKRLDFVITSNLNGQMNLKKDNTLRPTQYVSNNTMVDHEIALLPPDYLYLKNNATSILVYWFIDCGYYGITDNFTFSYKYTKPESQHVIEALIVAGFEPITTPAPITTTTTNTTTTTTTTTKPPNSTITTTSKPLTTAIPVTIPTTTTLKPSIVSSNAIHKTKRDLGSTNIINMNGSSVNFNESFPFVCLNQTNMAQDAKKVYGYFTRTMVVKDNDIYPNRAQMNNSLNENTMMDTMSTQMEAQIDNSLNENTTMDTSTLIKNLQIENIQMKKELNLMQQEMADMGLLLLDKTNKDNAAESERRNAAMKKYRQEEKRRG